jgi:hypothetical protein
MPEPQYGGNTVDNKRLGHNGFESWSGDDCGHGIFVSKYIFAFTSTYIVKMIGFLYSQEPESD